MAKTSILQKQIPVVKFTFFHLENGSDLTNFPPITLRRVTVNGQILLHYGMIEIRTTCRATCCISCSYKCMSNYIFGRNSITDTVSVRILTEILLTDRGRDEDPYFDNAFHVPPTSRNISQSHQDNLLL